MKFSQARLLVTDFGAAFRFGRVAYLRDPSGNLIELFQTLPHQE
jgi:hypothetical protein